VYDITPVICTIQQSYTTHLSGSSICRPTKHIKSKQDLHDRTRTTYPGLIVPGRRECETFTSLMTLYSNSTYRLHGKNTRTKPVIQACIKEQIVRSIPCRYTLQSSRRTYCVHSCNIIKSTVLYILCLFCFCCLVLNLRGCYSWKGVHLPYDYASSLNTCIPWNIRSNIKVTTGITCYGHAGHVPVRVYTNDT
jgi:hypothetical protein